MSSTELTEYRGQSARKFNLRDLAVVLFRRRWIVLGVSLPIIFFGIFGTLTTVDTFTASSQILIEARAVEDPSFQQRPVVEDVLMSTAAQIAQSIPVATLAAAIMIDELPALRETYPVFETITSEERLRDLILSRVDCDQVGESNLLNISYTHEIQPFALMVVDALTEAFITFNIEKGQNTQAIDYYSEQIERTEAEMAELVEERVAVFDGSGLNAFKMNNEAGIQQMRAMEANYHRSRSVRVGLESRYDAVLRAVASNPDYMPAVSSTGKNDNLIGARSELDEAVLALARLRMTYQDSSQHVIRQARFVEEARRIFHEVRADYIRDLRIELDIARTSEESLKQSLEKYQADLLAYPELEKDLYLINMRIDAKKDLLEALQTKRGEVRLKVQGDQRISNITQLNEPSIDAGVGGGKKAMYVFVAMFFAVALGVIVALLVDTQDHRIYDPRQAEIAFEVPVLGSISPADRIAEKQ